MHSLPDDEFIDVPIIFPLCFSVLLKWYNRLPAGFGCGLDNFNLTADSINTRWKDSNLMVKR